MKVTVLILLIAVTAFPGYAQEYPAAPVSEPTYDGRPLSQWIEVIRDRSADMPQAFRALQFLGPRARAAVPELTRIVREPFMRIRIGVDDRPTVAAKLSNIGLRADAIDTLRAIGEAASSSTDALIQWALTRRIDPEGIRSRENYELYVDLVTVDIEERMRVVVAVEAFGPDTATAIATLLSSPKDDNRKLGVAILGEDALPIAAKLLKSDACDDRRLGTAILTDLWSVISREHALTLTMALQCEPTAR